MRQNETKNVILDGPITHLGSQKALLGGFPALNFGASRVLELVPA